MIKFKNISLSFGTGPVFNNLSFVVETGMHSCISGPSGKGKSSILKMIQGYVLPDKGSIWVDGLEFNTENVNTIRSKLAFVPQNINLPVENGKELVALIGEDIPEDLIIENMRSLGLSTGMFVRSFGKMSGGQKQRIVIAVCLSLPREIVLLDEPTASLDDDSIDRLIRLTASQKGKTVVSASHNHKWITSVKNVITL